MEKHEFQVILEDAEIEFRPYSGRGMYGKECLGIVAPSVMEVFRSVLDYVQTQGKFAGDAAETFSRGFENAKTDSMGMEVIVYFPDVHYTRGAGSIDSEDE